MQEIDIKPFAPGAGPLMRATVLWVDQPEMRRRVLATGASRLSRASEGQMPPGLAEAIDATSILLAAREFGLTPEEFQARHGKSIAAASGAAVLARSLCPQATDILRRHGGYQAVEDAPGTAAILDDVRQRLGGPLRDAAYVLLAMFRLSRARPGLKVTKADACQFLAGLDPADGGFRGMLKKRKLEERLERHPASAVSWAGVLGVAETFNGGPIPPDDFHLSFESVFHQEPCWLLFVQWERELRRYALGYCAPRRKKGEERILRPEEAIEFRCPAVVDGTVDPVPLAPRVLEHALRTRLLHPKPAQQGAPASAGRGALRRSPGRRRQRGT